MTRPGDLIVGRIYFEVFYEDEDLRYPMIHSYEYCGVSQGQPDRFEFRILGSNDLLLKQEADLEELRGVAELAVSLAEWRQGNPGLAS